MYVSYLVKTAVKKLNDMFLPISMTLSVVYRPKQSSSKMFTFKVIYQVINTIDHLGNQFTVFWFVNMIQDKISSNPMGSYRYVCKLVIS